MKLVNFGSIMSMEKGKKPVKQFKECENGLFPYVDIKAFETGVVGNYTDGDKCLPCNEGDVLIVCDGSRSGLVGRAIDGFVGSTLAKITAEGLIPNYLFYFLQGKYALLNTRKKGTGTPHLNPELLKKQKIYVPDFAEQPRIVARIEELFSQLDKGVETLQTIKQQLAVYRQAVLKEAFEGKLTKSTPLKHDNLLHYIEKPRYGTSKKCSYECADKDTPVYRIPNIDWSVGRIDHEDIKYAHFSDKEVEGIRLEKDDILIIRSNGSVSLVGRAALISQSDTCGSFAGYLMRIRVAKPDVLIPKFLLLYLNSHQARVYIENKAKSTSGVNNINSDEISRLPIPLFSHQEQVAIIEEIESRLSVCDSIEQTVDTALAQAEALRQSILKKAFEGGFTQ